MSVGTASVRGGVIPASIAVSSSMSRRRPASTTFQPASNSACAVARPMPLPAPVITAIFASVAMSPLLRSMFRRAGGAQRNPPPGTRLGFGGFRFASPALRQLRRPAALAVGAVPEQEFVLRRPAEGAEHRRAEIRARGRRLIGGADDPGDRGTERLV